MSKAINLKVDEIELEAFCKKIIKRSRDITKTHDALITLETFISLFGKASHGTNEYYAIEETIKSLTEQTRQQVLKENADKLIKALCTADINAVTSVHTPLSRNGFYKILEIAINHLSAQDSKTAANWSVNWVNEAKQKAELASGYPDALDFKTAGISIDQYQAMADVSHFLNLKM
jgi:hypothetical protein